ncbi:hypothetical protein PGA1_c17580 [Phaeobacter inhibens DSM 17395]|nr:hypothetical protein PGA1_c17580 [Phaeobacter inhibens DSM 17395]
MMFALGATTANAEGFCVAPVAGSEAHLPVEFEQPYRIATSPRIVPGFDGLIVKALNRHELYEFNGSSLSLMEDDFPHVWGFAFEHGIHIRPDGEAFGFGSRPRVIFHLGSNASNWEPIESTRGYAGAFFDQGAGSVYWQASSSMQLERIKADGISREVDLPEFNGDHTVSVRTISEISGALALTGPRSSTPSQSSSMWFRPLGSEWVRTLVDLPDGHRLLSTFQDAQVDVSNGIVRVFPFNNAFEPLIFRFSEQGLQFVSSLPAGIWRYHPSSQNWVGRSGPWVELKETSFAFWKEEAEKLAPQFLVLGPSETEARLVSGLLSAGEARGQSVFYHPEPIIMIEAMPIFVRSERGFMFLDGVQAVGIEALRYEKIGIHPSMKTIGELNIIQSELGVFVLSDDLSLRRIDNFPAENPWPHEVIIEYVETWQTYIIIDRRSGEIHVSKDMQSFSTVESEQRINASVGVLLEPTSVLVVGEDRLYAVTQDCASQ